MNISRGQLHASGAVIELSLWANDLAQGSKKTRVWKSLVNLAANLTGINKQRNLAAHAFLTLSSFDPVDTWRVRLASSAPALLDFADHLRSHCAPFYMHREWAATRATNSKDSQSSSASKSSLAIAFDWPTSIQV